MGFLGTTTQNDYYTSGETENFPTGYGSYQFTSLNQIINNFMYIYVGEGKIISKANRTDVQFHGMRAIQELSYDILRSFKSQEIEVPNTLKMALPQDYINYIKLTRVDSDGIEKILYPTGKTSNPFGITQNDAGVYQFTGDNLTEQTPSDTWSNYQDQTEVDPDTTDTTDVELDYRGRRYGLDPQYAQANGTFYIDYLRGMIHFGSSLAGDTIILKYVSDGLGIDTEIVVHKFCEEACYKWIAHGILSTKSNMPEQIIARYKKERFAETRKAKIRLSNIKIEEFTQVLKGLSKPIK
tara:strand:+ start:691 stop:1578 length:888 start_codon:yes stop_codon:yes gene_type:complete